MAKKNKGDVENTSTIDDVKLLKIKILQPVRLHKDMTVFKDTKGQTIYDVGTIDVHPDYKSRLEAFPQHIEFL